MNAVEVASALSILAFLFFGTTCLCTRHMVAEFERYGLARLRVLTGVLQVAGALGLLMSRVFPWLLVPAAAGLSLLMLLGVVARLRIHDPFLHMTPALALMLLNAFIVHGAVTAP